MGHLNFVLPAPSRVLSSLQQQREMFLFHTKITCQEMAGGMLISFCLAFPLAFMMAVWAPVRLILQPLFVIVQCIPMFTLAPLMVLWFDWSYTAIVIPTALMIFFPLTMNLYAGICSTPRSYLDIFSLYQATRLQTFFKLQLPWSLPHIFSGIRISSAIAGIGAIAGEWAGGQNGLGVLMLESRRAADLEITFGALFCLTALSLLFYGGSLLLEKKFRSIPALFLSLFLVSCEGGGEKVRLLLDWFPNPNHTPLYVGIEKGFFEKRGIPLQIYKTHDPSDGIPYLTSGKVELAISYMPHTLQAILKGAEVKAIGVLFKQPLNALIYRLGEGIEKPADLSGKVLGFCVDGTQTSMLDNLLRINRIEPAAKRNVSFDLVSMLGMKKVDVIYGAFWNVEGAHLKHMGVECGYFSLEELGMPNYYELIILALSDSRFAAEPFCSNWKKGLQESIDFCRDHPEEAYQIYLKHNPDKGKERKAWEKKCWDGTYGLLSEDQLIDEKEWKSFVEWLRVI